MKYESIPHLSRNEAQEKLETGTVDDQVYALWSIALYDADWKWAQTKCLEIIQDKDADPDVKSVGIRSLGHIARIHRQLDLELVMPLLNSLKDNSLYIDDVETALGDIGIFIK